MTRNKFHLLHVRLDAAQYEQLEKIAASRPSSNLSDVVREALSLITNQVEQRAKPVVFSRETYEVLSNMASELNRSPSQVAEDCVSAVLDSFHHNRSPLIVEELKLRRQYTSQEATAESLSTTAS
ncbi:MAG: hypothetical protein ACAI35_17415 [Candidatus Methylacidiphilales bacterium]|nr:hypothetical protein [Candidatus Methylacidiphilales bacterium]